MHTHDNDHDHSPEEISKRLSLGIKTFHLREWVYGGIDGVVTTFAIIAGVLGAELSAGIIIVLGLANLIGDGFSMAAGAYSGAKADDDNYKRLYDIEASHIEKYPEGEREEIRQIFAAKGFEGEELEGLVKTVSSDHEYWIEVMLQEEFGVSTSASEPFMVGAHTFFSFIVCGAMPLLPFLFFGESAPLLALIFAAITFFVIGSVKSMWSVKSIWREGTETIIIGMSAAAIAYGIGYGLRHMI